MGLVFQKLVKDRSKRELIYIMLDIILIIVFLYFALTVKTEWYNGFEFCRQQACEICLSMQNVSVPIHP